MISVNKGSFWWILSVIAAAINIVEIVQIIKIIKLITKITIFAPADGHCTPMSFRRTYLTRLCFAG